MFAYYEKQYCFIPVLYIIKSNEKCRFYKIEDIFILVHWNADYGSCSGMVYS